MFDQLFTLPGVIARHANAPFAEERAKYLDYCKQRGDTHGTLLMKAHELLWAAYKFQKYPDLDISMAQLIAVANDWRDRELSYGRKLNSWSITTERFITVVRPWLRYLGYLQKIEEPIPFQFRLDEYCLWATHDRGLSATTIKGCRFYVAQFLRWYGPLGRPIESILINDVDAYLAYGHSRGWCRVSVHNVANALRVFFRYGGIQGWCSVHLANAIQGPRMYALEGLPIGPAWNDVQRLFSVLDLALPKDVRDRAIFMLLAIYGLRESEVVQLCLDDIDWEHDLLRVSRAKGRGVMNYPLLPLVGNAIFDYLRTVRPASTHRRIFLSLLSPHEPLSRSAIYAVVAPRLKSLKLRIPHFGPHSLRHACAARLVSEGLSLKEIGDHLGHRDADVTRIYAKVDLIGLRKVAAFDLGELS